MESSGIFKYSQFRKSNEATSETDTTNANQEDKVIVDKQEDVNKEATVVDTTNNSTTASEPTNNSTDVEVNADGITTDNADSVVTNNITITADIPTPATTEQPAEVVPGFQTIDFPVVTVTDKRSPEHSEQTQKPNEEPIDKPMPDPTATPSTLPQENIPSENDLVTFSTMTTVPTEQDFKLPRYADIVKSTDEVPAVNPGIGVNRAVEPTTQQQVEQPQTSAAPQAPIRIMRFSEFEAALSEIEKHPLAAYLSNE